MAMLKTNRVCIITTAHDARDDRIFHKQAMSLAGAGFDVSLIARWTPQMDSGPIQKVSLPEFHGKFDRIFRGTWCAFWLAMKAQAGIYHFHDPELLPLGVALKLCGKRVLYDVHEDYSKKILSRRLPAVVKIFASKCLRVFETVCAWSFDGIITADSYVASLFPSAKTRVIANYPPLEFVRRPTIARRGLDSVFRVVYVGGISQIRGIGKIMDVLDLLGDAPIEFHLAGDVADKNLLKRLINHSRVVYHGVLPWENINQLLAQADVGMVLFQPVPAFTYYPGENIIKLWEYLGMGLPVIISNFPKLKQLVETLDVGIAVDATDPAAIAAAIQELRNHPSLRRKLGENGKAVVQNERNWAKEAGKLVGIYQKLV